MPSLHHDCLATQLGIELCRQLDAQGGRQEVIPTGTATFEFHISGTYTRGRLEPDLGYTVMGEGFPRVVVLIAYSQSCTHMAMIAEQWIAGGRGTVRLVVGIDIPYRGARAPATIHHWTPQLINDVSGRQVLQTGRQEPITFRGPNGEHIDGTFEIPVRYFTTRVSASPGNLPQDDNDDCDTISLSLAFLRERLAIADQVDSDYRTIIQPENSNMPEFPIVQTG